MIPCAQKYFDGTPVLSTGEMNFACLFFRQRAKIPDDVLIRVAVEQFGKQGREKNFKVRIFLGQQKGVENTFVKGIITPAGSIMKPKEVLTATWLWRKELNFNTIGALANRTDLGLGNSLDDAMKSIADTMWYVLLNNSDTKNYLASLGAMCVREIKKAAK